MSEEALCYISVVVIRHSPWFVMNIADITTGF